MHLSVSEYDHVHIADTKVVEVLTPEIKFFNPFFIFIRHNQLNIITPGKTNLNIMVPNFKLRACNSVLRNEKHVLEVKDNVYW